MTKKNSKKKKYIDVYSTIYEVDIVVANEAVTLKDLKERYTYSDGIELDDALIDGIACTCTCQDKTTGRCVVLTKFNHYSTVKGVNKNLDLLNTAAHEATHIVLDIYSFIDQPVNNTGSGSMEHMAYFVGWVTEKVYETWTKK